VEDVGPGCAIARPPINAALAALRRVLASFPNVSAIPQISIDCAEADVIAVVSYTGRDTGAAAAYLLERRSDLAPLTGVFMNSGRESLQKVYGDGRMTYTLPSASAEGQPCTLSYQPGGFSQVNRDQNRAMLGVVRQLACFQGAEQVLDLYCGNGNFTLPIAAEVAGVTGIEESGGSIAAAGENRSVNGIANTEFICADACAGLKQLIDSGRRFDTVILDPPRSGAAEVMPGLSRLSPERILYISCDPSTLARDCGTLAGNGYLVRESVPLDMFPQTYHLESVTLLQKQ
jgi:23S rRNA (uracil1939-C5)-methyltransferase